MSKQLQFFRTAVIMYDLRPGEFNCPYNSKNDFQPNTKMCILNGQVQVVAPQFKMFQNDFSVLNNNNNKCDDVEST